MHEAETTRYQSFTLEPTEFEGFPEMGIAPIVKMTLYTAPEGGIGKSRSFFLDGPAAIAMMKLSAAIEPPRQQQAIEPAEGG